MTSLNPFAKKPVEPVKPTRREPEITLEELESVISQGLSMFASTGRALSVIRDRKMYLQVSDSWESYLSIRWKMGSDYALKLVNAAKICQELKDAGLAEPVRETQARELQKLEPEARPQVWSEAVAEAGGPEQVTSEQLAAKGAKHRKRKARQRKPAMFKSKGKGWKLTLSRTSTAVSIVDALKAALAEAEAQATHRKVA
jgi:hypothetical protein